jgi:hypothetical protein
MNSRMASVLGSSTKRSAISPTARSTSLPTEISREKPMPRASARDSMAPIRLPLWLTSAQVPLRSLSTAKAALAVSATGGLVLTVPMLLGPTRRIPVSATTRARSSWSEAPAAPASAKPPARMDATFTPRLAHAARAATAAAPFSRM